MLLAIVDTNADHRIALADVLMSEGHEVVAGGTREAVSADLAGRQPDVLLTDMQLVHARAGGDMDAFSLVDRPTRVVVLTNSPFEERSSFEAALGPVVMLEDPYGIDELLAAIDIARRRTNAEFWASRPPRSLLTRRAVKAVTSFLALGEEWASMLVTKVNNAEGWHAGPASGIALSRVPTGDAADAAEAFLVWIADGATYPHHKHTREEAKLLLRGGLHDDDGAECWAGECVVHGIGTSHASTAIGGAGCLLAAILRRP